MKFSMEDHMFLKVSPINGTLRFNMRGKLSPRYVESLLILKKIGNAVYKLALPLALCGVDNFSFVYFYRRNICQILNMC